MAKLLLLFHLILISSSTTLCQLSKSFSPFELKSDLTSLKSYLQKNPNLYLYSSKESIDSAFSTLESGLTQTMNSEQYYQYVSSIQTLVKDGHNYLLPDIHLQTEYSLKSKYFPLNITVHNDKMYILQNFSNSPELIPGLELVRINNWNAMELFQFLVKHQVRDGHNLNYPIWISQHYFRSYYGFLFGFCNLYQLEVRDQNNLTKNIIIEGLALSEIRQRRKSILPQRFDRIDYDKGIFWCFDTKNKYALLTIKSWSHDILKSDYKQSFKHEINDFLSELKKSNTKHLVIDIRGNQGGDSPYGAYLLQHLLEYPFQYFNSVKTYKKNGKLRETAISLSKTRKPASYIFKGNLYVLTDGGSFSNSGIFASLIKIHKRGLIIGSETGGNSVILTGGEGYYVLPYTKINILKATHQMIVSDKLKNTGRGVIPDIEIKYSLENILYNQDKAMEKTLELISISNE